MQNKHIIKGVNFSVYIGLLGGVQFTKKTCQETVKSIVTIGNTAGKSRRQRHQAVFKAPVDTSKNLFNIHQLAVLYIKDTQEYILQNNTLAKHIMKINWYKFGAMYNWISRNKLKKILDLSGCQVQLNLLL